MGQCLSENYLHCCFFRPKESSTSNCLDPKQQHLMSSDLNFFVPRTPRPRLIEGEYQKTGTGTPTWRRRLTTSVLGR